MQMSCSDENYTSYFVIFDGTVNYGVTEQKILLKMWIVGFVGFASEAKVF